MALFAMQINVRPGTTSVQAGRVKAQPKKNVYRLVKVNEMFSTFMEHLGQILQSHISPASIRICKTKGHLQSHY